MGPRVAGLGTERARATSARWRERLERTWGVTLRTPPSRLDAELARCVDEWEAGLARIDFPELTDEDRVTFLEHVVSWQVRRALRAGRFDLALAVSSLGARRVAQLLGPHERGSVTLRVVAGTAHAHDASHLQRREGHAS
jgi:hypothetical protein